jgi:HEAT repeat protein
MRLTPPLLILTLFALLAGCGPSHPPLAGNKWADSLHDPDPTVRKKAAFTLGNIGSSDPSVVPALLEALKDSDASVRREAILALVKCGNDASEAIPILTQMREHDPDQDVRQHATKALQRLQD